MTYPETNMTYSENKYFTKMNVAIGVALCFLLKIISFVNPKRINDEATPFSFKFGMIVAFGVFASMFELLFLMMWLSDDIVISSYLYGVLIFGFVCAVGMFVAPFVEDNKGKLSFFILFSFLAICLTIVYFSINNYLIYYRNESIDVAWIVSSIMIICMLIITIIGIIMAFKEDKKKDKKKDDDEDD